MDGLQMHYHSISVVTWQHATAAMLTMLTAKQPAEGLQLSAVVGIGRLLLRGGDEPPEHLQTEQLIAALAQVYIQPPSMTAGAAPPHSALQNSIMSSFVSTKVNAAA